MEDLPLVLLGLRAAWREGPNTSPSEMLYGTTLRLPGQFVPGVEALETSKNEFLSDLQRRMRQTLAVLSLHHSRPVDYIPAGSASAEAVYVRHDAQRRPLQRPYDGPFEVLSCSDKFFVIN